MFSLAQPTKTDFRYFLWEAISATHSNKTGCALVRTQGNLSAQSRHAQQPNHSAFEESSLTTGESWVLETREYRNTIGTSKYQQKSSNKTFDKSFRVGS